MARTLRWTEPATQDLQDAAEFIGRDSRLYAAALVRETQCIDRTPTRPSKFLSLLSKPIGGVAGAGHAAVSPAKIRADMTTINFR